jgi:GntR family transcriptional repressor for pyruvate dehydrogenase complex
MTNNSPPLPGGAVTHADDPMAAERVVMHIEKLIQGGHLKPGDRLPAERELARQVKVSRPSVRAGLRSLAAVGVVEARHGSGSFITSGPPRLSTGPLSLMAALHGFTRDDMFDARRAEEVAGMFASLQDPQAFLVHDVSFHRAIATASHNPVLAALVELVSTMAYERRRLTVERARDLKESADMHRRIYSSIRDHDADAAQREMRDHLDLARMAQASEETATTAPTLAHPETS